VYRDPRNGGILVPVELATDCTIRLAAYVDTGAAECIFEREYAEALGLELPSGVLKRFSTASGGLLIAFGHNVRLSTLGHSVDALVFFADEVQLRRNVLGRQGWLNRLRIGIVHYDSKLYVSDYD
jgi:predicted aspartyl protease